MATVGFWRHSTVLGRDHERRFRRLFPVVGLELGEDFTTKGAEVLRIELSHGWHTSRLEGLSGLEAPFFNHQWRNYNLKLPPAHLSRSWLSWMNMSEESLPLWPE
ncbi:hypothetical protein FCN77_10085 [Arthrobacter sp. 24S4-2]|uniref:hypothetical protein n=1 Tax=Arthrobacter sp. 24S4-2 TaxID=2575374 RepID=UPI0010C7790A|nr:hypothetical protein [Arthrobacter sp. 24S4-2]QCO97998.1 hypothetical protein FCN77_10085 [Arthrobacter sp. 24S4-2]